jgi:hypothetical protein
VCSGFRAQGSKQGRVCCAAELLPSPDGNLSRSNRRDLWHLVPDSDEYLCGLLDDSDVAANNG